ncbi:MAG: 4Fe-4S binding protein [Thermoplasmata archaeon]|nr:4Fe-4S binding protein [Thermoplasmata archaeon]
MKQIAIISGKGGTGKTTITAAFASLAENAVLADCDVDAADLHLILQPDIKSTMEFKGLKLAKKDQEKCISCGKCLEHCRFHAIDSQFNIKETGCEGCGVCEYVCPTNAIELMDRISGHAYLSETRFGPMAHAALKTAEEASGMLVSLVRNNARQLAKQHSRELIIIDGPPGIGCPVIAAIAGVDLVLVVSEPTVSGVHDAERVIGVARHFQIPAMLLVNKFDLNLEMTEKLEKFCLENEVSLAGRLPYDNVTTEAMIASKTVIEHSDGAFSQTLREIWNRVLENI